MLLVDGHSTHMLFDAAHFCFATSSESDADPNENSWNLMKMPWVQ